MNFRLLLTLFLTLHLSANGYTQDTENKQSIYIYLDCRGCSENFIRSEISFVNFVRDQADAEVHLLITRQQTGSGGREYTLNFIGLADLSNASQEIKFTTAESDTDEERRNELVRYVKLGLIPFLSNRPVLGNLDISYDKSNGTHRAIPEKDPWDNWVFEIGGSSNFSGEEARKNLRFSGGLEARRITDEWKLHFEYDQNFNRRSFTSEDDSGNVETDVYTVRNKRYFGLIAKSLNDHWTIGAYKRLSSSTQDNIDLSVGATPSIEFSVFPYHEYTRREITIRYGVLTSYYNYSEPTIFFKNHEVLLRQELNARMDFTQPWGGVFGWLNAGNYIHDFTKNRLNFGLRLNMRVYRGLNVFVSGRYSLINDQLSLPAGDTSDEELLLDLKQQATSYNYGGSVGFEFNFGSIYNNVINPRL